MQGAQPVEQGEAGELGLLSHQPEGWGSLQQEQPYSRVMLGDSSQPEVSSWVQPVWGGKAIPHRTPHLLALVLCWMPPGVLVHL